jgi:hypothetical protein
MSERIKAKKKKKKKGYTRDDHAGTAQYTTSQPTVSEKQTGGHAA